MKNGLDNKVYENNDDINRIYTPDWVKEKEQLENIFNIFLEDDSENELIQSIKDYQKRLTQEKIPKIINRRKI